MPLEISDCKSGCIHQETNHMTGDSYLRTSCLKRDQNKDKLEKLTRHLIETTKERKPEHLEKMISFLSPELRTLERQNPDLAGKIREIVHQLWPELYSIVDHIAIQTIEENVKTISTLQEKRAFYLLEKMRVKLGGGSFENLLQKGTTYDMDFLELLAFAQEDMLLSSYLNCWCSKYPDLIIKLNEKKYLKSLVKQNCPVGVQTFSKIIKQLQNPLRKSLLEKALKPDSGGSTLMHFAVHIGNTRLVFAVWELHTIDMRKEQALKPNNWGLTPLHLVARFGNTEIVSAVISLCTTNALEVQTLMPDGDGNTPLHLAGWSGNPEAVRAMLKLYKTDRRIDGALRPNHAGDTPLHLTVWTGNPESVRVMWELHTTDMHKEQALKQGYRDFTLLHYAVMSGKPEVVGAVWELLTTPAQKKQAFEQNQWGHTPLHTAVESGDEGMVSAVADLCTTDALKEQALKRDKRGVTPLFLAVLSGNIEKFRMVWELYTTDTLKEQAFRPNNYGSTLMFMAVQSHKPEMVRVVWELHTTDVLKKQALKPNDGGFTPLNFNTAFWHNADVLRVVREFYNTSMLER